MGFATLTSATSVWSRQVLQSTDSTEALQNINNLTHLVNGAYVANYIQNLYVEVDPTRQFSEELRLTSNSSGPLEWVGGLYYANLHSGYITYNQAPGFATALTCGLPSASNPVAGSCPAGTVYGVNSTCDIPTRAAAVCQRAGGQSQRRGVQRQQPQRAEAKRRLRRGHLQVHRYLKLTAGLRFFHFAINNSGESGRPRHGIGEPGPHHPRRRARRQCGAAEVESRL
jgi:hypothetical protein